MPAPRRNWPGCGSPVAIRSSTICCAATPGLVDCARRFVNGAAVQMHSRQHEPLDDLVVDLHRALAESLGGGELRRGLAGALAVGDVLADPDHSDGRAGIVTDHLARVRMRISRPSARTIRLTSSKGLWSVKALAVALVHRLAVVGVDAGEELLVGRQDGAWLEPVDPKQLVRPPDDVLRDVPTPSCRRARAPGPRPAGDGRW